MELSSLFVSISSRHYSVLYKDNFILLLFSNLYAWLLWHSTMEIKWDGFQNNKMIILWSDRVLVFNLRTRRQQWLSLPLCQICSMFYRESGSVWVNLSLGKWKVSDQEKNEKGQDSCVLSNLWDCTRIDYEFQYLIWNRFDFIDWNVFIVSNSDKFVEYWIHLDFTNTEEKFLLNSNFLLQ